MKSSLAYVALFLAACATTPNPPIIADIKFLSANKATVLDTIVSGDYSEDFEVLGYKIRFESNIEIAPKDTHPKISPFGKLEYFECGSERRPAQDSHLAARQYVPIEQSWLKILERNNGTFIYEAQLIERYTKNKNDLCAKVFVHDGNIRRKIWYPAFISNEILIHLPDNDSGF